MAGAKSFTELDAWRLANELKLGVYELIRSPEVQRDFEFRDQIRNAAASAPRNIAEGFGRYVPRDFAQYLRIANGSLMETANHLRDGVDRGYFTADEIVDLLILAKRSSAATTRLIKYLQHAPNPRTRERPMNPRTPEPRTRTKAPEHRSTKEPFRFSGSPVSRISRPYGCPRSVRP
jgi:four helix bundle protein